MQDQFITWPELAGLVAYLASPVIVVAAIGQVVYLRRCGLGLPGRRLALFIAVGSMALAVYLITPVLWILVPPTLLDWPGTFGDWPFMMGGVFFIPSLLAALVAAPVIAWLVGRRAERPANNGLHPTGAGVS